MRKTKRKRMGCKTSKAHAAVEPLNKQDELLQAQSAGKVIASADPQAKSSPWSFPLLMKNKTRAKKALDSDESNKEVFSLESEVSGQSFSIPNDSTIDNIRLPSATNTSAENKAAKKRRRSLLSKSKTGSHASGGTLSPTRSMIFPSYKSINILNTTPPTKGWYVQIKETFWKKKFQLIHDYADMERIDAHTKKVKS